MKFLKKYESYDNISDLKIYEYINDISLDLRTSTKIGCRHWIYSDRIEIYFSIGTLYNLPFKISEIYDTVYSIVSYLKSINCKPYEVKYKYKNRWRYYELDSDYSNSDQECIKFEMKFSRN